MNIIIYLYKVLISYHQMGSVDMNENNKLKEKLVELKLEKRELVLSNKNTNLIDKQIKEIEEKLKNLNAD